MTKYTGKHRKSLNWNHRKTIASALIAAGILAFPSSPACAEIFKEKRVVPPVLPPALRLTPVEQESIVPVPPDLPGNGDDELKAWLAQGAPGYILDPKDSKGLVPSVAPVPQVVTVEAVCDKPDLPYLSGNALNLYHVVCALFPEISVFGGYRAGDQDHGTGNAIDAMVYGDYDTGEALASFLIDHADELHIKYLIWQQHIWQNLDGLRYWVKMEDRGSPTANHMDHVHASVN